MNRLKIYLRTNGDIDQQAATYAQVFSGKVIKRSFIDQTATDHSGNRTDVSYANIQIANCLTIMISKHKESMPAWGYSTDTIITYDNLDEFEEAYSKLVQSDKFKVVFDKVEKSFGGGVVIAKFIDVWGFNWIIERKREDTTSQ